MQVLSIKAASLHASLQASPADGSPLALPDALDVRVLRLPRGAAIIGVAMVNPSLIVVRRPKHLSCFGSPTPGTAGPVMHETPVL